MIRRSFRIGLWLGVLGGLGYAVLRLTQGKKPQPAPPQPGSSQPWQRLEVADKLAPAAAAVAPLVAPQPAAVVDPRPPPPVRKAPAKKAAAPKKALAPWVDPKGDICPKSHPVKAKLSSGIFQVVGNFAYDRTKPDRCYKDEAAALNDGLRAAKR
ncbi:MAG: hypothetical protein ACR2LQ_14195 [Acidimicrobiales bacterium]